jgi:hypothetical protein
LDHEYGIIRTLDFQHPTASRFLSPYIRHDGALRWQTPDIGEQWVAGMVALSEQDFVNLFASQGVTPTVAALIKLHVNDDMARRILANDHSAGTVEDMHHVATTVNATTATIDAAGHWWMCSHLEQAASILIEYWANFEN